jgi:hypothetical protein
MVKKKAAKKKVVKKLAKKKTIKKPAKKKAKAIEVNINKEYLRECMVAIAFIEGAMDISINPCWHSDLSQINLYFENTDDYAMEFKSMSECSIFLGRIESMIKIAREQRKG